MAEAGKSFNPGARQVDPALLEGLKEEDQRLVVLKNKRAYLGHIRFIGKPRQNHSEKNGRARGSHSDTPTVTC